MLALTRLGVGLLAATGIGLWVFVLWPSSARGMEAIGYGFLKLFAACFAAAISIPLIYAGFGKGPLTRIERRICIGLGLVFAAPVLLGILGMLFSAD